MQPSPPYNFRTFFISPQKRHYTHYQSLPSPPSSLATTHLVYVSMGFPILDISYKWTHNITSFCVWLPCSVSVLHSCFEIEVKENSSVQPSPLSNSRTFSSLQMEIPSPLIVTPIPSSPQPLQPVLCSLWIYLFWTFHINEIIKSFYKN